MITANSVYGILSRTAISTLGANWLLMIPSAVTSLMVVYAITISCPEDVASYPGLSQLLSVAR